jgi:hypothetical protein
MKLTKTQFDVLDSMVKGSPFTLWPTMRRAFLRAKFIAPAGKAVPPANKRYAKIPVKPYRVTEEGHKALEAYDGPRTPHHETYPKILFGRAAP